MKIPAPFRFLLNLNRISAFPLLVVLLAVLSSCSSDSSNSFDTTARSVINNGFYLSERFEYGMDGALNRYNTYDLDHDALTITSRDMLQDGEPIDALYKYSAEGDLESISYIGIFDADSTSSIEYLNISSNRENGVLTSLILDYKVGNESDRIINNYYDDTGRLSYVVSTYEDTQISSRSDFYYNEDGQLQKIVEEDPEGLGVSTRNFIWNNEELQSETFELGLVFQISTYVYDGSGNITSIDVADQSGNILSTEEYFYETSSESVFNLILENHFYHR